MNTAHLKIAYAMTLMATEASTGFFACLPDPEPDLEQALSYLSRHPLDTFMHRYALALIGRLSPEQHRALRDQTGRGDSVREALLREAALKFDHFSADAARKSLPDIAPAAGSSPLINLRALSQADHAIHRAWNRLLNANLENHQVLPEPDQAPRPWPYRAEAVADRGGVYITRIRSQWPDQAAGPGTRPSSEETAAVALDALRRLNLLEGEEMRHEASLSPYALLHQWRLNLEVDCGRHHYTLAGLQTAYGRGLDLAAARASYAMEIVERCSSFANIAATSVRGCRQEHRLYHGSRRALQEKGLAPIDPNAFGADVLYKDEPLHWIEGVRRRSSADEPVLVPVQSVFLFTNLDEVDLYAGHGSTGLASGNTMAEAKLSALMELVERDGEATHPFHYSTCFQVEARDPGMAALLEDYRGRGIQFQFQDISPPYGIPCCKCFVTDMDGRIAKGTAASLNGRRAVVSALTETPYPYPYGPPSGPGMLQLPRLSFEDLPDYSSGNAETDLALVEALLAANGYEPVYVDLTRADIRLPVVRALLPGFALTADLEGAGRVHPRLFGNYLNLFDRSAQ